ncbi:dienelactone hydrolase family protein [Herbiconiux moechotypicola]|uniref:Dienelactone hydrolase family protein n=1 Tax=Herbiconiux moechotypicola TaxID=637393 RepID=A0ABP5QT13_9MICO|nr:dienelactone hydrolase family protein [Herbiconiux moechotypicola]MCS5730749.1 dienelactone hydrolase family protein [Herbiconiux moechotypicola]
MTGEPPASAASGSSPPVGTLDGWTRSRFTGRGLPAELQHDCFEKGSGPGVVLIPELPGITPEVLGLAEHLVESGFTVVVPSPFGQPGRPVSGGYLLGTVARICVSAEFRAFAVNASRPLTLFLRAVAADLAARTPGRGVGVIGMCFTGGFALAAAVDDSVLAAVVSQPAAPFPLGRARQADPSMSEAELSRVAERASAGEVCALGLRFSADRNSPRARFDTLRRHLGDAFEIIELDSSPGNPAGFGARAHSVLTTEVRDLPGHPALAARTRTVAFLHTHLTP